MKKALWQAMVFVATILAASASVGQTNPTSLIVDIPFRFVAANQTLPPGRYLVTHMGETDLRIHGSQDQGVLIPTHAVQGHTPEGVGRVVFLRYGETCVLSQVWFASGATGRQVFRSRIEQELARVESANELAVMQINP
jgi:hypothetical protein